MPKIREITYTERKGENAQWGIIMHQCHQIGQRLAREAAKLPWPFRAERAVLRAPIAGDHDYGGLSGAPAKRKATPGKPVTANRIHRYAAVVRVAAVFVCLAGISLAA